MSGFEEMLDRLKIEREKDEKRFNEHDGDLCMLCYACGPDKRSLFVSCLYDIKEVVPEAVDLAFCDGFEDRGGYYLRICKSCRGSLLGKLGEWRLERIKMRDVPKREDGEPIETDVDACIPVRVNGATVMMTEEQFEIHKLAAGLEKETE